MADRRRRHDQKVQIWLPSYQYLFKQEDRETLRKLEKFIGDVEKIMKTSFDEGTREFAKTVKKIVKTSLQTGKPPRGTRWVKHAEATKRTHGPGAATWSDGTVRRNRKKHNAIVYQDYKLLNLTGSYERAVDIFERRGRVLVGLPSRQNSSQGGITLNALAIILEYGSGVGGERQGTRIPPRSLWKPAFQKAGGEKELKRLIYQSMSDKVYRKLRDIQESKKMLGVSISLPKMPKFKW